MTTENLEVNNENIKKILNLIQIGKISEAINDLETITKKEKENYKYFFFIRYVIFVFKEIRFG